MHRMTSIYRHVVTLQEPYSLIQHDSSAIQSAKHLVSDYCANFDRAEPADLSATLKRYAADRYYWRGLAPFGEQDNADEVVDVFWKPLRESFTAVQRRVDVFFAGHNDVPAQTGGGPVTEAEHSSSVWTCQMGHFMGLMDKPWLDIPPTRRIVFIRFTEFHRVYDGKICESAMFIDLMGAMRQAGQYPLPPSTGESFIYPGPATADGVLSGEHPSQQSTATLDLINRMIADLSEANRLAQELKINNVPRELLAKSWDENMVWYGPEGIGATYTIDRYQQQHQYPFRFNLTGKKFNGHIARFSEGQYGGFFGWPNLTNTAQGGFLGLPASGIAADMRVMDVYRSNGEKLVENWVIIDLHHWLCMQGLDVLKRMRQLLGIETLG